MRRVSSILSLVAILALFLTSLIPFCASAGPLTIVTLDPEQQEGEIDVSPGSSATSEFQLTVEA